MSYRATCRVVFVVTFFLCWEKKKKSIRRHHTSSTAQGTMRIGQTNPFLLSEQHQTHLLILFITLITGMRRDTHTDREMLYYGFCYTFKRFGSDYCETFLKEVSYVNKAAFIW